MRDEEALNILLCILSEYESIDHAQNEQRTCLTVLKITIVYESRSFLMGMQWSFLSVWNMVTVNEWGQWIPSHTRVCICKYVHVYICVYVFPYRKNWYRYIESIDIDTYIERMRIKRCLNELIIDNPKKGGKKGV